MRRFLSYLFSLSNLVFLQLAGAAQLNLIDSGTIFISDVSTFCQGNIPHVRLKLLINGADKALPGLVYIGAHNPDQTKAAFYRNSSWGGWNSGLFPPNRVVREGLNDMTLTIPLNQLANKQGWRLYVGYGVLTAESEQKVQLMLQVYHNFKTKFPDRQISIIEPDHYRRTLVQKNMVDNLKYQYVLGWSENLMNICTAQN